MSRAGGGSFGGELGLVGLFDLCQLLMMNGATGCLAVAREGRQGYLYFRGGRVVNALDDERNEGEPAAHRLLTWKTGRFEFRPEPVDDVQLIEAGTEALMLEAARRIDEGSDAGGGNEAARLRDRQGAMDALRDVFHRVAREAAAGAVAAETAAEPAVVLLHALRDADDRLLCRPQCPPRLWHDGSWLVISEAPLGEEVYGELRERVLGGREITGERGAEGAPEDGPVLTRTVALEGGGAVTATLLRPAGEPEALWIRPARLPAPGPSLLSGPLDSLRAVLDVPQGLVLAGGPTVDAVERLLHAVLSLLQRRRSGSVLLAGGAPVYDHREDEGVILRSPPEAAREALRSIAPACAVFEATGPAPAAQVEALRIVPLVLVGVVATDAGVLLARWLAGLGPHREAAEALLATVPVGLVHSPGVALGEDRIPFTAGFAAPGPRLAWRPEAGPRACA